MESTFIQITIMCQKNNHTEKSSDKELKIAMNDNL